MTPAARLHTIHFKRVHEFVLNQHIEKCLFIQKRHHRPLPAAGKYILLARQFAAAANVNQSFCGQRQFIYLQMIPFNQNATPSIIGMA